MLNWRERERDRGRERERERGRGREREREREGRERERVSSVEQTLLTALGKATTGIMKRTRPHMIVR